jgi:hypothetical protein
VNVPNRPWCRDEHGAVRVGRPRVNPADLPVEQVLPATLLARADEAIE